MQDTGKVVARGQGSPRRRHFTREAKRRMVEASLAPGASVSAVALANGVNTNQLFKWRRLHLRETRPAPEPVLLPVRITPPEGAHVAPPVAVAKVPSRAGAIEIEVGGVRVRLKGTVDVQALRSVLELLK